MQKHVRRQQVQTRGVWSCSIWYPSDTKVISKYKTGVTDTDTNTFYSWWILM